MLYSVALGVVVRDSQPRFVVWRVVEVGKMLHPTQSHAKTTPCSTYALPPPPHTRMAAAAFWRLRTSTTVVHYSTSYCAEWERPLDVFIPSSGSQQYKLEPRHLRDVYSESYVTDSAEIVVSYQWLTQTALSAD